LKLMILRRSSRTDPRLVLGSALALVLPIGAGLGASLGASSVAWAQTPEKLAPPDATTQSPAAPLPASPESAPSAANSTDALKQHDQELDSALARQRESVDSQAKLRIEIEALSEDRRKFNQDLIGTAARVRDVETNIDATRARLVPLDEQEELLRKSLNERRDVIVEILAALQRIGRQPPPALIVLPEMRAQADSLAGDLADLVRVRKQIVDESNRLSGDLSLLGHEQLRLTLLIDQRQKNEASAEQALNTERQHAAVLARQVDSIKDLIAKLEAGLDPATRAAHDAAHAIADDATQPQLAALSDPGRLTPAVAFPDMRGHMHLPVNGVPIRAFGGADGVGGTQKGVSIASRPGAEITAPCDGWVVYAGPFRSYGQLLILNAGGGYHVLLAGMDRISVDLGQFVLTGEPVAMMGDTSQTAAAVTTGPKQPVLYVEFRKDGTPIDPSPWWATNEGEKVRG
jgi:septal ring factor EnvC (AmiA/AmiB activator)